MIPVYWLIAFVVLIGIELGTMALTTIWFAGGALAAFIFALLGAGIEWQAGIFIAISLLLLFFTRPFATKYINKNTVKTNAEGLIGKHAKITAEVNDVAGTGAAVINGQEWTARAVRETDIYAVGTMVEIKEIRGVKLIVEKIREEIR